MDDGKLLSTYDDAAPTPDAHLAGLRAVAKAARAERSLSGDSAAGVGVTNPFVLHAVGTLREEIERLRDLLRACVPELLGENWQETRYCTHCRSYDGHTDGCLITRIEREVT